MRVEMKGQRQLVRQAVASADPAAVWNILVDSGLLPQWVPAVRHVESCEVTGEAVGTVRHCRVELGGRPGTMVERCVSLEPERHIALLVDDESFGMRKMFADYGFVIALEPLKPNQTRVIIETFYTPRNAAYRLMNTCMMRSMYRRVVDDLLAGLVRLAEQRTMAPLATHAADY
jgi:uncharacterized protein YndB with AHSA1/START domain